MKSSCDIIRDLIPLYIDDVASPSSRRMVEEHLAECADCRGIADRLRNREVENAFADEKEEVIASQRRSFEQKSAVVGGVIAGILMIPVLVCLIVNLATGAGLGWFFIVLAALLTAASLTVVPLTVPEDKGLWTLGSFAASLLLLLGVCCLYGGGRWFFAAGASVLFGLAAIFLPFAVRSGALSERLDGRRAITVMAADTLLFLVMMLAIGLYAKAPGFFPLAAAISLPLLLLAWAVFLLVGHLTKLRTKRQFLDRLEEGLSGLPEGTVRGQLALYGERIDKRIEEGLSEKAAVAEMGPIERIVSRVRAEHPTARAAGRRDGKRRLRAWEIVLLALGSPLWIALLAAASAVMLALWITLWAVIVSLWAAEVSFIAGAFGGVILGIWAFCRGSGLQGIVLLCAAAVLAGLSIFLLFGCLAAAKGAAALTKTAAGWLKSLISGRENVS